MPALTYDAENHLTATGGQTYLYDGDRKRVEKATTGTPLVPNKLYWYHLDGNVIYESDASGNEQYRYYYFAGRLVKREEGNDWVDQYGLDALGNVRWLYSFNGGNDIIDYYPFGGERLVSSTSAGNNTRLFTSKERDSESGLDNFGARYNSSSLGRFISPDPDNASALEADPQSWNAYAYAGNNPINGTDPDGEDYYLLGGDKCGRDVQCDDNGHLLDSSGNAVVIRDPANAGAGVTAKLDGSGNLQFTTSQGTFQGEFFDPNIGSNG